MRVRLYRAQVVFYDGAEAAVEHGCMFDFRESPRATDCGGERWLPLGVEDTARMVPCDPDRRSEPIVEGATFDVRKGRTRVGAGRMLHPVAQG
jgi:hypothetical protein